MGLATSGENSDAWSFQLEPVAIQEIIPFHELITPLTEPGQALQRALMRTVLPPCGRLPAPLL